MAVKYSFYKGIIIRKLDKHNFLFNYRGKQYGVYESVYECRKKIKEIIKKYRL